jgi:hypothetical protein
MLKFKSRNWKELKELDKELHHRHPILLGAYIEYQEVETPDLSYLDTTVINGKIKSVKYTQEEYDKNGHDWLVDRIIEDQEEKQRYNVNWCLSNILAVGLVAIPGQGDNEFHTIKIKTQGTANVDSTTISEARLGNTCYSSIIDVIENKEIQELKHILSILQVKGMDIIGGHLSLVERNEF